MAEPEGGSVLLLPRRYLAVGAAALFICAGIPPADVTGPGDELAPGRRVVTAAPAPVQRPSTIYRPPQLAADALEAPPPGQFIRLQEIPRYKGSGWVQRPVVVDEALGTFPEGSASLTIPYHEQRPNTSIMGRGAQAGDIPASTDHLTIHRREFPDPSIPVYYAYRGQSRLTPKTEELPYGRPMVLLQSPAERHRWNGSHALFIQAGIPPADAAVDVPIQDRIRIVTAIYPYQGESFWRRSLLVEVPAAGGVILVPSSKVYPDFSRRTFIRGAAVPPADVAVSLDAEGWQSRRAIKVPSYPYSAGQFVGKGPQVADVVTPELEETWPSHRVILNNDYSKLWANPNLSYIHIYQVEDDLSLVPGIRAIMVPAPRAYEPGQFHRGTFQRVDIIVTPDELVHGRRVIIDGKWYRLYRAGSTQTWSPLLDHVLIAGRVEIYVIRAEDRSYRVPPNDRIYRIPKVRDV